MSLQDQWRVAVVPSLRECGFEDIHFKGNFQDFFVHHKDYIHDGGWQGVKMVGTVDSWVRRCVFTDVNGGAALEGTMNCSILLSAMAGNRGHTCFNITFGSNNLVGCNVANEDRGGINGAHGIGISHLAHNNVAWRFKSKIRGIDFHGTFPFIRIRRHVPPWWQLYRPAQSYGRHGDLEFQANRRRRVGLRFLENGDRK
jgi:hypothetical protein